MVQPSIVVGRVPGAGVRSGRGSADLADTSVLLRIPSAPARTIKPPTLLRNQSRKPTLACEPLVSALTEVARLLPPGRCVT